MNQARWKYLVFYEDFSIFGTDDEELVSELQDEVNIAIVQTVAGLIWDGENWTEIKDWADEDWADEAGADE